MDCLGLDLRFPSDFRSLALQRIPDPLANRLVHRPLFSRRIPNARALPRSLLDHQRHAMKPAPRIRFGVEVPPYGVLLFHLGPGPCFCCAVPIRMPSSIPARCTAASVRCWPRVVAGIVDSSIGRLAGMGGWEGAEDESKATSYCQTANRGVRLMGEAGLSTWKSGGLCGCAGERGWAGIVAEDPVSPTNCKILVSTGCRVGFCSRLGLRLPQSLTPC